ncbi:MAG TPA: hypothetical protein VGN16_17210, partial [Acidobacteriaceae bacterium]
LDWSLWDNQTSFPQEPRASKRVGMAFLAILPAAEKFQLENPPQEGDAGRRRIPRSGLVH